MRANTTVKQLRQHPAVHSISDERSNGDGIWVYLSPGFRNAEAGTHCVHEQTWAECIKRFNLNVTVCHCRYCSSRRPKGGNLYEN